MSKRLVAIILFAVAVQLPQLSHSAVILQYHHVSNTTPKVTSIAPELFAQHMDFLAAQSYKIWPLPKLVEHIKLNKKVPDKVIVITFDDAYESIYKEAFPLLKQRQWPFTVFVATDPVDKRLAGYMSWQQINTLAKHGATIANHTLNHHHLVRRLQGESTTAWQARIRNEITGAADRLEQEVGQAAPLLAYPYGEYTADVQAITKALGYTGFGQQSGAVNGLFDHSALPRFPMNNDFGAMEQFQTKISSLPLAPKSVQPANLIIRDEKLKTQGFRFSLHSVDGNLNQLRCYYSGHGQLQTKVTAEDGSIRVTTEPLPTLKAGRSRINCTMPANGKSHQGRFYWFSHYWMRPLDNGDWYAEP